MHPLTFVALDHIQLAMPAGQEDVARRFYRDILGMTEVEKPEPLRSSGGVWFEMGDIRFHLGVQEPFIPSTKGHPGFTVVDLDSAETHLAQHNIPVKPDTRVPTMRRFYVSDPFGNRLEFMQAGDSF